MKTYTLSAQDLSRLSALAQAGSAAVKKAYTAMSPQQGGPPPQGGMPPPGAVPPGAPPPEAMPPGGMPPGAPPQQGAPPPQPSLPPELEQVLTEIGEAIRNMQGAIEQMMKEREMMIQQVAANSDMANQLSERLKQLEAVIMNPDMGLGSGGGMMAAPAFMAGA